MQELQAINPHTHILGMKHNTSVLSGHTYFHRGMELRISPKARLDRTSMHYANVWAKIKMSASPGLCSGE